MINKLRDLRVGRNLTQLDVASKIGTNDLFISKIEMGKAQIKLEEAARLAYIYKVTLDDIYEASKCKSDIFK